MIDIISKICITVEKKLFGSIAFIDIFFEVFLQLIFEIIFFTSLNTLVLISIYFYRIKSICAKSFMILKWCNFNSWYLPKFVSWHDSFFLFIVYNNKYSVFILNIYLKMKGTPWNFDKNYKTSDWSWFDWFMKLLFFYLMLNVFFLGIKETFLILFIIFFYFLIIYFI